MVTRDQNTVSLLRFDGNLTDETGKIWTSNGSITFDSSQSKLGSSIHFDGATSYLSTPNGPDFSFTSVTLEGWFFPQSLTGEVLGAILSAFDFFDFRFDNGMIGFRSRSGSNVDDPAIFTTNAVLKLNQWQHIAWVISQTEAHIFVDGISQPLSITGNLANAFTNASSQFIEIGRNSYEGGLEYYHGYMDELKISNVLRFPEALNQVILAINLLDGERKEYELTASQVTSFVDWYNNRAAGTGAPYYVFDKDYVLGPFGERKDYIAFAAIAAFEIMKYPN